jgi:hypothetical protein
MWSASNRRTGHGVLLALVVLLAFVFLSGSGESDPEKAGNEAGEQIGKRGAIANLNRPQGGSTEFFQPRRWANCARYCPTGPAPFELETAYIYPKLQRGVDHYVTSCWGGGTELQLKSERRLRVSRAGFEWQGKAGQIRVPLVPGESFAMDAGQHRYHVRCLPPNFPGWAFERHEDSSHKFYSVAFGRSNDNEDKNLNPFVVIFDQHGVPVWWQDEGPSTLGGQVVEYEGKPYIYWRQEGLRQESFIEDHHQLHTLDGTLAHQFESPRLTTDGHEFNLRKNGDAWLVSYVPRDNVDFSDIGGPESAWSAEAIVERVRDGKTIWRWSTKRNIRSYEARRLLEGKFGEKDDGSYEDPFDRVHVNSVEPAGNRVIVSMRNTDGVYGVNRVTGEIAWKLGGVETPESLRTIGDYYEYPSGAQHDARVLSDGTLSVFDNRSGLGEPPRVTRWRINEEKMTARLVEAYEDPLAPNSPATGSARFSSDGSVLVYWGDSYLLTEFTPEGSIAFRLSIGGMAYRAHPVPDGLVSYRDFDRGMDAKGD